MPARSSASHEDRLPARSPSPPDEVSMSPSPSPGPSRGRGRPRGAKRKRSDDGQERSPSVQDPNDSEDALSEDVYDPDQPADERRFVQRSYRELLRDLTENSEAYLSKDSNGLHDTIRKADALSKKLRQTTEATIDSRLLVNTTDLSYRRTLRLTQGSMAQGLDVDEFVSKCITYMRAGGGIADDEAPELSSMQRQRRRNSRRRTGGGDDHDEEPAGDDGDMMNWQHLGRYACLPHLRRPALPGFLLGPLSVEKKARKATKRGARFRPNNLTETRPEVLDVEDLAKKEDDLTSTCGKILQRLEKVQRATQQKVVEVMEAAEDMDDEASARLMHKHGLRSTGGMDLMRFVVNPQSFAQTVENLFYVSFLVRDGRLAVELDEQGLPSLAPVPREADEDEKLPDEDACKHQAVWSMDMKTWRDIIDVFGVTEPMIEHRPEPTREGPGARSWYS